MLSLRAIMLGMGLLGMTAACTTESDSGDAGNEGEISDIFEPRPDEPEYINVRVPAGELSPTVFTPSTVNSCDAMVLERIDVEGDPEIVPSRIYRELTPSPACACGCPDSMELNDVWETPEAHLEYLWHVYLWRTSPAIVVSECCDEGQSDSHLAQVSYEPLEPGRYRIRIALLDELPEQCTGTGAEEDPIECLTTIEGDTIEEIIPPCQADAWLTAEFDYPGQPETMDLTLPE